MTKFLFILLSSLLIPFTSTAGDPLTLQECFERALVQSEALAIREEEIRAASGRYLQALGTVLPHLSLKASEFVQDTGGVGANGGTLGSTFTRRTRPEVSLAASQPLFQGLREIQALKVAGADKKKSRLERDRARELLFLDVARTFSSVLELENEVAILESLRATYADRVTELKTRVLKGRSRSSELLSTEAQAFSQEAELERVRGQREAAREMLGFLIGGPVETSLVDDVEIPQEIGSLEGYLEILRRRPDVGAAHEALLLARGQLNYERGGHLPTIRADANYYPYRVGFYSEIDWDVVLRLDLPIFMGGETQGKVREAKAAFKQSQWTEEETRRKAELETRQAYTNVLASRRREVALAKAERKAGQAYAVQEEEYRTGLASNLEALQALREWQERRREASQARTQAKIDYIQLQVAAGMIPGEVGRW